MSAQGRVVRCSDCVYGDDCRFMKCSRVAPLRVYSDMAQSHNSHIYQGKRLGRRTRRGTYVHSSTFVVVIKSTCAFDRRACVITTVVCQCGEGTRGFESLSTGVRSCHVIVVWAIALIVVARWRNTKTVSWVVYIVAGAKQMFCNVRRSLRYHTCANSSGIGMI